MQTSPRTAQFTKWAVTDDVGHDRHAACARTPPVSCRKKREETHDPEGGLDLVARPDALRDAIQGARGCGVAASRSSSNRRSASWMPPAARRAGGRIAYGTLCGLWTRRRRGRYRKRTRTAVARGSAWGCRSGSKCMRAIRAHHAEKCRPGGGDREIRRAQYRPLPDRRERTSAGCQRRRRRAFGDG